MIITLEKILMVLTMLLIYTQEQCFYIGYEGMVFRAILFFLIRAQRSNSLARLRLVDRRSVAVADWPAKKHQNTDHPFSLKNHWKLKISRIFAGIFFIFDF